MPPIHLIINPHSAGGRTARVAVKVIRMCDALNLRVVSLVTERPGHATEMSRSLPCEARVIAVLGGDGTLNEVVNGAYGKDLTVALLPSGTGNDFAKTLGISKLKYAVHALAADMFRDVDVSRVQIETASGNSIARLFVNAVGIGFDAAVAYRASTIRIGRGLIPYLIAVFATLRNYRAAGAVIRAGGDPFSSTLFLACAGNGRSSGGGFMLTPRACFDDGLLDLCMVRSTPVLRILQVLPRTFSGSHLSAREVRYEQAPAFEFDLDAPLPVHADGELLARDAVRVRIHVMPQQMRFICPPPPIE